jgi:hypothetical protein
VVGLNGQHHGNQGVSPKNSVSIKCWDWVQILLMEASWLFGQKALDTPVELYPMGQANP